jgi:hypothetical protein
LTPSKLHSVGPEYRSLSITVQIRAVTCWKA